MAVDNFAYIYFGTGPTDFTLEIPYPEVGLGHTRAPQLEFMTTANNELVSQEKGRDRNDMTALTWGDMPAEEWWAMGIWLAENGPRVWVRYFDHNLGKWAVSEYYCTEMTCGPITYDESTGEPNMYLNCSLTIVDAGGAYATT